MRQRPAARQPSSRQPSARQRRAGLDVQGRGYSDRNGMAMVLDVPLSALRSAVKTPDRETRGFTCRPIAAVICW